LPLHVAGGVCATTLERNAMVVEFNQLNSRKEASQVAVKRMLLAKGLTRKCEHSPAIAAVD